MITSTSNAKIKQVIAYRTKAKERREAGVFVTEGPKLFEEAPAELILETYVSEDAKTKYPQLTDKLEETGYETVSEEVFRKMSDTQTPQGILCVMKQPVYTLEEMLAGRTVCKSEDVNTGPAKQPLLVLLENLQDPGNLGTILRTGEGAGITGVIMSSGTVDIFNPKVIRSTMGSIFRVPFLYVPSLADVMGKLQAQGIRTYAAHLAGETYYDSFDFRAGTAFLIGNEGNGLSKETADLADSYLKIPMEGEVESLNAAVATSLLVYEAHRQRGVGK